VDLDFVLCVQISPATIVNIAVTSNWSSLRGALETLSCEYYWPTVICVNIDFYRGLQSTFPWGPWARRCTSRKYIPTCPSISTKIRPWISCILYTLQVHGLVLMKENVWHVLLGMESSVECYWNHIGFVWWRW
jgi:hypothetical protein